jgi:IS5 family transposase
LRGSLYAFRRVDDEDEKRKNRTKSRVRAKVEWPFRILKRVFGYSKVRYRGMVKNHHWHPAAFALVYLYPHRKRLIAQLAPLGGSVSGGRETAPGDAKPGRTKHIHP